jgi:galactokinase/mevalonate kinase-like predicted kinase
MHAKTTSEIEPRFRQQLASEIKKMRSTTFELAESIKTPPSFTGLGSSDAVIARLMDQKALFLKRASIAKKTPVQRGGGDDVKYLAMARNIDRAIRIFKSL